MAFDTDGNFIPASSCGTLVTVQGTGTLTALSTETDENGNSYLLVSGAAGVNLGFGYGYYSSTPGCTDSSVAAIFRTVGSSYLRPIT